MDILSVQSWIIVGAVALLGMVLAPILQAKWLLRLLIASYISLSIVLLVPNGLQFSAYANGMIFVVLLLIFTTVGKMRFFDATEWFTGRFDFRVFCVSVCTMFFISAIACSLLPFSYVNSFIPKELYDIFVSYIFYFSLVPLGLVAIFR